MKKQNFLLLEVLLALTLIALFAGPLMRLPILHYQAQMKNLETFECQRLADISFTEVKEMLYQNRIPWASLPAKGKSFTLPHSDTLLEIPYCPVRKVTRTISLTCTGEKQGLHGEIFRMILVKIKIGSSKKYPYRVLVQRLTASSDLSK